MQQMVWVVLAWMAGTAAILGSLMTLGSLLLYLVPSQPQGQKAETVSPNSAWQNRLKLLGVSLAMGVAGGSLLLMFDFLSSGE